MAAGISIGIAADTRAFASGVRSGVLQPLEGVEDALKDVGREGDDATSELTAGFRGAQRATRDLEKENQELADTIQREARKSSRAVRDIGDDGFRGSSEAVRGFKDEAVQNFSEVASSFDGTVQGIADGVQGTLGGLATAISGPVGLALGGVGLIAGAVASQWADSATQIQEDWQAMYDDMVESGTNFLSQDLINKKLQELAQDQGKVNDAVEEAKDIGTDYTTILRAQAGDAVALRDVLADARGRLDEANAAQATYIEQHGDESAAIADTQGQLEILIGKYDRMIDAQDSAAGAAQIARKAMDDSAEANNRTADSLDRVANSANGIPPSKSIVISADTRAFEAEMERIRRQRYTATLEVNQQHRGTQVVY